MSREEAKHHLDCETCMDKNMDYQHIKIHLFHGEAESMTYSSPSLYQHSKQNPALASIHISSIHCFTDICQKTSLPFILIPDTVSLRKDSWSIQQ